MAAYRPKDWHVLDMDRDPTPGDPQQVRQLARKLHDFADDVNDALRLLNNLASDDAFLQWAGKSADAFEDEFDHAPKDLKKLKKSYDLAGDALAKYWPKLENAQAMADRALQKGREAQADLTSAKKALGDANDWVSRATAKSDSYDKAKGKKDVPPPDEKDVREATRNAQHAHSAKSTAQSDVNSASSALEAAKRMANEAKGLREDAARECKDTLEEASDAGIQNRKWWEEIGDWVSDNWDSIVAVCKVVVAVLGIVVMIIGGPILAAIVIAAALVVLADTLHKYANGEASLFDVGMAALDCIPGAKGLTTAAGLAKGLKTLAKGGLKNMAKGPGLKAMGRKLKELVTCGDPVDMATGEMVMAATDIELSGVLPLVVERTHRTRFRKGRLFGPSWSSTLDQHLELDRFGVEFVTDDGMVLQYPVPQPHSPVLPVEGPRWPLEWDGEPFGQLTVHQPESGRTLSFTVRYGSSASTAPLTEIRDRNGNTVTLRHDAEGLPTQLAHHGGYRLGISCENGRITALTLLNSPDETRLLTYSYDDAGNLAGIVDSTGTPQRLSYDEARRITGWQDRNGSRYRYEYDSADRCVATTGDGGFLDYRFRYDLAGQTTTAVNSLGHATTYRFNDACQLITETDPLGHTVSRTYDRYDRLLTSTDQLGHTTRLEWDEAGNLTARHAPDGTVSTARYNTLGLAVEETGPDGAVWRQEWDEHGNCLAVSAPDGARVGFTHDSTGAVTSATGPDGLVSRFTNDPAGLLLTETDPAGAVTALSRDAFGRITEVTGPLGARIRMAWTPEGRLASRTGPGGATESWTYDGEGNRLSHRDPAGGVTRFTYTHFGLPASRTTPDGARFVFRHDTELRLAEVINPLGLRWSYELDPAGRLVSETDFDGRTLRYAHDPAGRILGITNPAEQTLAFRYDSLGNVTEKSRDGQTTGYRYDAAGRLLSATGPDSALAYSYDAVGRVLSETTDGRTLRSAYDPHGRRTHRITPAGVESSYTYDAAGNRSGLDFAGRTFLSEYDPAGQEIRRDLVGGPALTRAWDTAGRLIAEQVGGGGTGPLPGGGDGRTTAGQPPSGQGDRNTPTLDRSYRYAADGSLTRITDRPGSAAPRSRSFTHDGLGRVTGVSAADWQERYAYDGAGNQTSAHWPDGQPEGEARGERVYEGNRLLGAGAITYTYDAAGRVIRRRKRRLSRKAEVWRYTWDAEDRLTGTVTPDGTRWRYRYDPLGRRTAKQRLSPDGERVVEETLFTWDGEHFTEQTRRDQDTGEETTLTWEREGVRPLAQAERVSRVEERTAEDGGASPLPSGEGPAAGGEDPLSQEVVDERFFSLVTDLVGTPTELVDERGEIAWKSRSTLWGLDSGAPEQNAYTPLRFPGQYQDDETGLHYNYFRHYDPATALYVTSDPLGLEAGPNPRRYVLNPLLWLDYLGLLTCRQNARRLRRALRAEGRGPTRGQAAAHLVPSGGTHGHWAPGANSRALLGRYGVDVNEAANGIPLGHPSPHNYTHRQQFLQRLDDRLQQVASQASRLGATPQQIGDSLRGELRRIGGEVSGELATGQPGPGAVWTA
ncbi:LipX3 [Streptomyces albus]|uniref:LipX3 n=1 Tax=Streptomyces albus (strain ATCC 21838 / DSM 41398 / FERM P-419 / JCM 4703 / NBRC 107858) TaxID=1081613 RepID=A0A0B5EV03_STRA4|nr:LipX3 [Streptomyces albus]AOU77380.1 LipX3 [Streptomyces albus]AYN33154.1 LipX3 [Streptomyces albus]